MVRQTSIDCYHKIEEEGLLSKRRLQAYKFLMRYAPCTGSELQSKMDYKDGGRDVQKRLSELRDKGVICEKGTKTCTITGKIAIKWDLTDELPKERTKAFTKKERTELAVQGLRDLYDSKSRISDDWKKVAQLIRKI